MKRLEEKIKHCAICGDQFFRRTKENGKLEKMTDFNKRQTCCDECRCDYISQVKRKKQCNYVEYAKQNFKAPIDNYLSMPVVTA